MNLPAFLWLILVPAIFSAASYLIGRIVRRPALWYLPYATALLGLVVSWIPFGLAASELLSGGSPEYRYGAVVLRMDGLSLLLTALTLFLGIISVVCGRWPRAYRGPGCRSILRLHGVLDTL